MVRATSILLMAIILGTALGGCGGDGEWADMPPWFHETVENSTPADHPLAHVQRWTYVIQDQWEGDKIDTIVDSHYDMVVLDDPSTIFDLTNYDAAADVARIKASMGAGGKDKIVLAYVDIGEAEDYRYYWNSQWQVGNPEWILAEDPDGWSGNYPVAYWHDDWYQVLIEAPDSLVNHVVANGYDGIYMDWIEAVSFEPVMEAAQADGLDPRQEMTWLIEAIRDQARLTNPDFLIVAQNAIEMRDAPGYLELLDAEAQEQVWFDGAADVFGDDPRQGDCRLPLEEGDPSPADNPAHCDAIRTMEMSSEEYVLALRDFQRAGMPVFTVDYALDPDNADFGYRAAAHQEFIGYVSMRSLEDITSTPPE